MAHKMKKIKYIVLYRELVSGTMIKPHTKTQVELEADMKDAKETVSRNKANVNTSKFKIIKLKEKDWY